MKLRMARRLVCGGGLAALLGVAPLGAGAVPHTMRYAGALTASNGLPYNGDVDVSVAIFAAAEGGGSLYTEALGTLAAIGGELDLLLGMGGSADLLQVTASSDTLWLEFTIDGETLQPRQKIQSVPFALTAGTAQSIGSLPATQVASKADIDSFTFGKEQLPYDGLKNVSNGTLTNEYLGIFVESSDTPLHLPDNTPAGLNATLTPPEVPGAVLTDIRFDFSVKVDIVSVVKITLQGPEGQTFTFLNELKIPGTYDVTYTLDNFPALGSLIGSDPSGVWTMNAADTDLTGPGPFAHLQSFSMVYDVVRPDTVLATGDVDVAGDLTVAGDIMGVGAVPSGAVMFFDLSACPPGWSPMNSAHGRVIVGVPAAGTVGATQGTPLVDQGPRTITDVPKHAHSVDPPGVTTTTDGNHSHCLNVSGADDNNHTGNFDGVADSDAGNKGCIRNTAGAGDHAHTVDIGAFDSAQTGVDAVDVTMPYVQLLVCRKN